MLSLFGKLSTQPGWNEQREAKKIPSSFCPCISYKLMLPQSTELLALFTTLATRHAG